MLRAARSCALLQQMSYSTNSNAGSHGQDDRSPQPL